MALSEDYQIRRKAAQQKLHAAIEEYAKEVNEAIMDEDDRESYDTDWFQYYLSSWVLVIHEQTVDASPKHAYNTEVFPMQQPPHVTKGLLAQGRNVIGN